MNELEARGKAYFIAAHITQGIAEHLPGLFDLAAEKLEVSKEDMDSVKQELGTTVVEYLQSQGKYYRFLAQKPVKIRAKKRLS